MTVTVGDINTADTRITILHDGTCTLRLGGIHLIFDNADHLDACIATIVRQHEATNRRRNQGEVAA